MQHHAWLTAELEKVGGRRWPKGEDPELPPLDEGTDRLVRWLFATGVVTNGGMGASGLSWVEIESWANLTGVCLTVWEAETLFEMSAAYAAMLERAKDPSCAPPWVPSVAELRSRVSDKLGDVLDMMMRGTK